MQVTQLCLNFGRIKQKPELFLRILTTTNNLFRRSVHRALPLLYTLLTEYLEVHA